MKPNWKALFIEARKLIENEVDRHENACGCQEVEDAIERGGVVEGHCPGLDERKAFLDKTVKVVPTEPSK